MLWPDLEPALWARGRELLDEALGVRLEREELRHVLTRALAVSAASGIPQGRWEGPPTALVEALVERIDQEMVDEVWSRIYRSVEVRPPTVRDRYHNMYRLGVEDDFRQHWALRGAALELVPVRSVESTLLLVCDFSAAERAELSGEFALPVAEDEPVSDDPSLVSAGEQPST